MSKNIENEYKTKSEPKHLSGAMQAVYCPDSDILILKCQCCNKVVAYCCHCNPILQTLGDTNLNKTSDINYAHNYKANHNIVIPIFDVSHNPNTNSPTNSNLKKPSPVVLEPIPVLDLQSPVQNAVETTVQDKNYQISTNTFETKEQPLAPKEAYQAEVQKQIQNDITLENIIEKKDVLEKNKLEKNNLESIEKQQDQIQQQNPLEMMHFCYKVETKLGEINLGVNYYQILELGYKATRSEIQTAYLHLLSEFNINKIKNVSLPKYDLESQVKLVIEAINQAAKTLLNSSLRTKYDKEIFEELNKNIIIDNKINNGVIYNNVILTKGNIDKNKELNNNNTPEVNFSEQYELLIKRDKLQTEKPIITLPPKINKPVIKIDNNNSVINQINNKDNNTEIQSPSLYTTSNTSYIVSENIIEEETNNTLLIEQNPQNLIKAKPAVKIVDKNAVKRKPVTGYMIKPGELKNAKKEIPVANDLYTLSLKCYETLNYERAIGLLQKALALDPNNALYFAQLGKTYNKMHNSQHRAESAYKEAVRLCPDNIEYLTELANLYKTLGKNSQAGEIFQKIFQLKYQNNTIYLKFKNWILKRREQKRLKREAAQERQSAFRLKLSGYVNEFTSWINLLFIVIGYKLTSSKDKSSSDKKAN